MAGPNKCMNEFNNALRARGMAFKPILPNQTTEVPLPFSSDPFKYSKNLIESIQDLAAYFAKKNSVAFELKVSNHVKVRFVEA